MAFCSLIRNFAAMNKGTVYCIGLGAVVLVLFALNLLLGSVSIPAGDVVSILLGDQTAKASWQFIALESRLPQAITATHRIRVAIAAGHHGHAVWCGSGCERTDAADGFSQPISWA